MYLCTQCNMRFSVYTVLCNTYVCICTWVLYIHVHICSMYACTQCNMRFSVYTVLCNTYVCICTWVLYIHVHICSTYAHNKAYEAVLLVCVSQITCTFHIHLWCCLGDTNDNCTCRSFPLETQFTSNSSLSGSVPISHWSCTKYVMALKMYALDGFCLGND